MWHLFKAELLRHWKWVAVAAVVHFGLLHYAALLGLSFVAKPLAHVWLLSVMIAAGGFGAMQMLLYRRQNEWVYLLHRPLPHGRMFLALAAAAMCLSLLMIFVPAAAALIQLYVNGQFGVELRHYQMLPYAAAPVVTAYALGCFAALGPSRLGFLALAAATIYTNFDTGGGMAAVAAFILASSLYIAYASFKPDLSRLHCRAHTLVLAELPAQYGILWALVTLAIVASQINSSLGGTEAQADFPAGTVGHVLELSPSDRMRFALEHSAHEDAAFLLQQVDPSRISEVTNPNGRGVPRRHQLPIADHLLVLADGKENTIWTFSHGAMLYQGRNASSNRLIGWLGPHGFSAGGEKPGARFSAVPWAQANRFIIDGSSIHYVDWDERRVHRRYQHRGEDRLTAALNVSADLTTLHSDDALYIFETAEMADLDRTLEPRATLVMPPAYNPQARSLHVLELIDGYLVAAVTDIPPLTVGADFALYGKSRLHLYRTGHERNGEVIANLPLDSGISDTFIYNSFVLSPGMRLLTDLAWGVIRNKERERVLPLFHVDFPTRVLWLAGFGCLLGGAVTAASLRAAPLPRSVKVAWITLNTATGFAGLISFLFGSYWPAKDQLRSTPAAPGSYPEKHDAGLRAVET
jgi:hypothetical protein